ncbi:MAG: cytochrome b/b6 domain-containing protein [Gammaproteobacteria bacterium]|nr:cytochrome b/b6 domain-containing protein [Gammaproteobacteria bacterium]
MGTQVYVWDRFVRFFHWSLVAAFTLAWLSAEENDTVHSMAGYAVIGLVLARLGWGLVGTRHARFADFVRGPRAVKRYLLSLAGRPEHHVGHNPAGGWMVVALLATLLLTTATGVVVYGYEGHGPLATTLAPARAAGVAESAAERTARRRAEHRWEEVHEFAANLTLVLVGLHVAGVVVASRLHRENLVRAMLNGYKRGGATARDEV